jgi:hypothetical protein
MKNMSRAIVSQTPTCGSHILDLYGPDLEDAVGNTGSYNVDDLQMLEPPGPGLWLWQGRVGEAGGSWMDGEYRTMTEQEVDEFSNGSPLEEILPATRGFSRRGRPVT